MLTLPLSSSSSEGSDYGLDYTTEEEAIIERLLAAADLEDDEERSGGARPSGNPRRAPEHHDGVKRVAATRSHAPTGPDPQSPLARFRTKPRKPLSVTDLVAPAWCELQYWYTLTGQRGRKVRTPAMRQGSAVHRTLERQVHRTVAVEVHSREDVWGLRLWNVVQGLRTLRETGVTRELEVWGVVDGHLVIGVIDGLSYVCPDHALEEKEEEGKEKDDDDERASGSSPPEQGIVVHETVEDGAIATPSLPPSPRESRKKTDRVYLSDVKTRVAKRLPNVTAFRPTLMQLMLYRLLLADLAASKVDPDAIFARFDLDADRALSDGLLAQLAAHDPTIDMPPPSPPSPFPSGEEEKKEEASAARPSLRALWRLMLAEFRTAVPAGVGAVLEAEYRHQADGAVLGRRTFAYDAAVLGRYLADGMEWWRGERAARGVRVEEAYKCRSCDFADACEWRAGRAEGAAEASRARTRIRTRSAV